MIILKFVKKLGNTLLYNKRVICQMKENKYINNKFININNKKITV